MNGGDLYHPAVDAVLATTARLVNMELVFLGGLSDDKFAFARIHGSMPGITEGMTLPLADSLCHRMLEGAPFATANAADEPAYADAGARSTFGITSYVGVPVRDGDGDVVATLCGIDRSSVPVPDDAQPLLQCLAAVVAAHLDTSDHAVVRRTDAGWRVGTDSADELLEAMVLADLLAGDLPAESRPPRAADADTDEERLRVAVMQLEHALAARVVVEQAIGVIAERQHLAPRPAFERLRKAARSRGRKVHDLARMVVASVNDQGVPLPPELAGRR